MIHDDTHFTCGACAIPMTDDDCVDVIDLHTHDCDVICHECAEWEWITDDFQIIPAHAFTNIDEWADGFRRPTPVEIQEQVIVVEIRTEWDSVTDVIHVPHYTEELVE